jgi:plasmid stabilization system protein ParE
MVTLHWTPQAVEDLHAIFEHISHDSNKIDMLTIWHTRQILPDDPNMVG